MNDDETTLTAVPDAPENEVWEEPGTDLELAPARDLEAVDITPVFQEGFLALEPLAASLEGSGPLPMAELDQLASRMNSLSRNSKWWLGDLLVYAATYWGEEWAQLTDEIGHTPAEVADMVYMAELFEPKKRLIPIEGAPGLTWTQHKLFAKFYEQNPRKAMQVMKRAAKGRWDDGKIRDEIKAATTVETTAEEAGSKKAATATTFTFSITVAAEEAGKAQELIETAQKAAVQVVVDAGITVTSASSRASGKVPTKG